MGDLEWRYSVAMAVPISLTEDNQTLPATRDVLLTILAQSESVRPSAFKKTGADPFSMYGMTIMGGTSLDAQYIPSSGMTLGCRSWEWMTISRLMDLGQLFNSSRCKGMK